MNFWTSGGDADRARRVLEQNSFPENRFEMFDLRSGAPRLQRSPKLFRNEKIRAFDELISTIHEIYRHHSQEQNEI